MFTKLIEHIKVQILEFLISNLSSEFKPFISQHNLQFLTCTSRNKKRILAQSINKNNVVQLL